MKRLILSMAFFWVHTALLGESPAVAVNRLYLEVYGICDDCYLRGINFNSLKLLPGVKITSMQRSDLSYADLRGLSLRGVDLSGSNLTRANMTGVDLTGAILTDAITDGMIVTDANLRNIWVRKQ